MAEERLILAVSDNPVIYDNQFNNKKDIATLHFTFLFIFFNMNT